MIEEQLLALENTSGTGGPIPWDAAQTAAEKLSQCTRKLGMMGRFLQVSSTSSVSF
jgi:hypothetical protein